MKRKENRGTVLSYSLPRRLLVLFLIFALTLYAVGMAVTYQLKEKARQDLQSEYRDRIAQLSAQFSGEIERIRAQAAYILTRSCVQQMELVTASVQFSEYYDAVRQTSELIHSLQNASGLIEHAMIFFPRLGKSVSYDSIYNTIAPEEYHFLTEYQKRSGRSVFMSVKEQLYLVSDSMRFANKTNSAVLVVEFSRDAMAEWCALFPDSNAVSVLCNASVAARIPKQKWREFQNNGICSKYTKSGPGRSTPRPAILCAQFNSQPLCCSFSDRHVCLDTHCIKAFFCRSCKRSSTSGKRIQNSTARHTYLHDLTHDIQRLLGLMNALGPLNVCGTKNAW